MRKEIIVDEKKEAAKREEELKANVIAYQVLQQKLEELKEHGATIEKALLEIEASKQVLSCISKEGESEVLIPLGAGCFIEGKLKNGSVLADVGSGVVIKKDIASAKKIVEERRAKIEKAYLDLQTNMQQVAAKMGKIAMEMEKAQRLGR